MTELRSRGIQPDVIVCRSDRPIPENLKRKISHLCDIPPEAVVSAIDASNLYAIPLVLHDEGLDNYVCDILQIDRESHPIDLTSWKALVHRVDNLSGEVRIGLIGKYVNLPDAYLSVVESLRHAGFFHGVKVEIEWFQAEQVPELMRDGRLNHLDGIVIPGGFGERGIAGKIQAAQWARETGVPCLGICLGLQVMVIDYARHVAGLENANSSEFDSDSPHRVVDLMDEQRNIVDLGGTMRLGLYPASLKPGTQVAQVYGKEVVYERHRHRYEVNPRYRKRLEDAGLVFSGMSPDDRLCEFIELPGHPWWVATQAHPEFLSRPERPHPLFRGLIGAAVDREEGRHPRLPDFQDRTTVDG